MKTKKKRLKSFMNFYLDNDSKYNVSPEQVNM